MTCAQALVTEEVRVGRRGEEDGASYVHKANVQPPGAHRKHTGKVDPPSPFPSHSVVQSVPGAQEVDINRLSLALAVGSVLRLAHQGNLGSSTEVQKCRWGGIKQNKQAEGTHSLILISAATLVLDHT